MGAARREPKDIEGVQELVTRRRARLTRRHLLRLGAGGAAGLLAGSARPAWAAGSVQATPALLAAPAASAESFSRERFIQLCLWTAHVNVKSGGWLVPSAAYAGECYLRDAYWTLGALDDGELASLTFARFAAVQGPDGRLPTSLRVSDGGVNHVRDDESSALFILLGLDLARAGWGIDAGDGSALGRAASFLLSRLDPADGAYRNGPGPDGWWLDTLSLAGPDVVAYTQGVVAVALRAAAELGAAVPPESIAAADRAYRALYRPDLGTLTLSGGTTLREVSSLVGDYLSWRYFDRPLLGADQVAGTLAGFRRVSFRDGALLGFRVATQSSGAFMPLNWFVPVHENQPGHYHNGASWLLYDALALGSAIRHGVPGAADLLEARLRAEVRSEWALHEYLVTDPASPHFGRVPGSWRSGYACNAYAWKVAAAGPGS